MQHVGRRALFAGKNALAFIISFLIIYIDDEHGEEDDDDYETKDMGVHDMGAMNKLTNSTNVVKHAIHLRQTTRNTSILVHGMQLRKLGEHGGARHGCNLLVA